MKARTLPEEVNSESEGRMSLQTRERLISRLFFQNPSVQKADLLRVAPSPEAKFHGTQTQLIALVLELLQTGHDDRYAYEDGTRLSGDER